MRPHWKGFGEMKVRTLYTIDKAGFQVDEFCHVGQWGTHVDPPLDPLTKELIYVAVSVTNNCRYCIASHSASARNKGMTQEQLAELLAVVGLANETNRLVNGYDPPVDARFQET